MSQKEKVLLATQINNARKMLETMQKDIHEQQNVLDGLIFLYNQLMAKNEVPQK